MFGTILHFYMDFLETFFAPIDLVTLWMDYFLILILGGVHYLTHMLYLFFYVLDSFMISLTYYLYQMVTYPLAWSRIALIVPILLITFIRLAITVLLRVFARCTGAVATIFLVLVDAYPEFEIIPPNFTYKELPQ